MRPWFAVPVVVVLGLGVRAFAGGDFAKYAGVALYATLIYALVSFWLPRVWAVLTAIGISWAVEFFQLTGIPAELSARSGLAHLVLGSTFSWPDLIWYVVGAGLGVIVVRPRATGGRGPGGGG
ncbi:ribosomal maturation YjgA family protein [Kribbella sp. NPDC055071]